MNILEAAHLMEKAYDRTPSFDTKAVLDQNGVQAYLLTNGVCLVPGTNELSDWLRFNLRTALKIASSDLFDIRHGASGMKWHSGFLTHAEAVFAFAQKHDARMLIGHSLGAASVSIAGASLRIPTLAFATPRPKKSKQKFAGQGWVLNILRSDDPVTHVPSGMAGFYHIGYTRTLIPPKPAKRIEHKMEHYITMLQNRRVTRNLPKVWPPS